LRWELASHAEVAVHNTYFVIDPDPQLYLYPEAQTNTFPSASIDAAVAIVSMSITSDQEPKSLERRTEMMKGE